MSYMMNFIEKTKIDPWLITHDWKKIFEKSMQPSLDIYVTIYFPKNFLVRQTGSMISNRYSIFQFKTSKVDNAYARVWADLIFCV